MKVDHWGNIKKGLDSIYASWYFFIYFGLVLANHYTGKHPLHIIELCVYWPVMAISLYSMYQYHIARTHDEWGHRRQ